MSKPESEAADASAHAQTETDPVLLDEHGEPLRFEAALEELEALVERMEDGELSLEDSVACFERGVALHRFCQHALEHAQRKVQILLGDADGPLSPFESSSADDAS